MKQNTVLFCDGADFSHRLNAAHLIVDEHDADEYRIGTYRSFHFRRIDDTVGIYTDIGNLKALFFRQILTGMEYGVMFDCRGDDVTAFCFQFPGHSDQSPVIRFRAARCKDDLRRFRVDQGSDLSSRFFQGILRRCSHRIDRGSIAIILRKIRYHLIRDFLFYRSRCGIVEIHLSFFFHAFSFLNLFVIETGIQPQIRCFSEF